jgi:menaquinone-dependent protoporphyrinogen oxidase
MYLLIAYATTDGQTRKIARFAADRLVTGAHSVELVNVEDAEGLDLARFDAAVLAGSLHAGGY